MTGNEVISEALLLINVIYPGQTLSPEASATSKNGFNAMLDDWSANGLAVYSVAKLTTPLTNGVASYTIGPGGNIAGPRPVKIEAWAVQSASGAAGSGRPVDAATFVAIAKDRSATGSIIEALTYDAGFPVGIISLYPIPNGGTLELWSWQQFAQIADFGAQITLPPGYLKAIIFNLAVDLAPKFGRPLTPDLVNNANACKAGLGATNASQHAPAPPPAA